MARAELNIYLRLKDQASKALQSVQGRFKNFVATFRQHWLAITASIAAGIYTLKKAYDAFNLGAKLEQQSEAFRNLARSFGASANKILRDLKKASEGTMTTAELMDKAAKAMTLGLDPKQFGKLMEIARASARAMGADVGFMFDSIVLGIGRQSKMILDNLGIIVRAEEAYKKYAEKLGKTAEELTESEKRQAFFNAVLEAGEKIIERVNIQHRSTYENLQIIKSSLRDARDEMLLFITSSTDLTEVADKFKKIAEAIHDVRIGLLLAQVEDLQAEMRNLVAPTNVFLKLRNYIYDAMGPKRQQLINRFSKELANLAIKLKEMGAYIDISALKTYLNPEDWERVQKAIQNLGKIIVESSKDKMRDVKRNMEVNFKAMEMMAAQAAANIQNAFSTFFFNVFTGEVRKLKNVWADFGRTMLQILANVLAQRVYMATFAKIPFLAPITGGGGGGAGAGGKQLGSPYIPRTGLYLLHRGEKVVPAHEAEKTEAQPINIYFNVQAWDAGDVWRNRKVLAGAIAEEIRRNAGIRGVIKQYG